MQYRKYVDNSARYEIAAKVVNQKITNSYNLLKELSRYYDVLDVRLIEKTFAAEEVNYNHNQSGKSSNNLLMMYEGRLPHSIGIAGARSATDSIRHSILRAEKTSLILGT